MKPTGLESQDSLVMVARAVRTKGLKGELVAEVLTDFPERFELISEITGVASGAETKHLKLERFSFHNDRVVLKFAGYDTIEAAETLVGFYFGVPEAERIELPQDEFYDYELEGCVVETVKGLAVGKVEEVLRTGGVAVILVRSEDGRESLIPMSREIVSEVNLPLKRLLIDPPDGLLDL